MRVRSASLVVAALVLTGCGSVSAPATTSRPALPAASASLPASPCPATAEGVAQGANEPGLRPLPADVVPIALIECAVVSKTFPGEGVWSVMQERRASSPIDALVAALRAPSEPTPANQACPAILILTPWFGFVDADGHWERPAVPRDSCGQPQGAVRAALDRLTFTTLSEIRLRQEQTPEQSRLEKEATALGCTSQFKDMIAVVDADPGQPSSAPGPVLAAGQRPTTLCRFNAGADPQGEPMLTFVSGRRLSAAEGAVLARALEAGAPVRACTASHTEVAGLFTAGNDWVLVELDGCHRTYGGAAQWRQASPALLAALA